MPSYQRLKTMVTRHIDQMIGTRNFKARNERIDTGVLVKSQKGKSQRGKENGSEKQMDSVQEETLAIVLSCSERHRHRLPEESPRKALAPE